MIYSGVASRFFTGCGAVRRRRRWWIWGIAVVAALALAALPQSSIFAQQPEPLALIGADQGGADNMDMWREEHGGFRINPVFNDNLADRGFTQMEVRVLRLGGGALVFPMQTFPIDELSGYKALVAAGLSGWGYSFGVGSHPKLLLADAYTLQLTFLPANVPGPRTFTARIPTLDPDEFRVMNRGMGLVRHSDGGFTAYPAFNLDLYSSGVTRLYYRMKDSSGNIFPSVALVIDITADSAEQVRWPHQTIDWYQYTVPYSPTGPTLDPEEEYTLRLQIEGLPAHWEAKVRRSGDKGISNLFTGTPSRLSYEHPMVERGWLVIWAITTIVLVLIFAWFGVVTIVNQHLGQPSVGWQQFVPRMLLALIAAGTSLLWCALILDLSDSMSSFVITAMNFDPASLIRIPQNNLTMMTNEFEIPFVIVLQFTYIAYAVFLIMVTVQMALRLVLINLLVVLAPVSMVLWILPQTAGWGRHWLRLFMTTVFQQAIQLLALAMGAHFLQTYLPIYPSSSPPDMLWSLLLSVGFMYMATRVPSLLGNPGTFDAWIQTLYFATGLASRVGMSVTGIGAGLGALGGLGGPLGKLLGGGLSSVLGSGGLGGLGAGSGLNAAASAAPSMLTMGFGYNPSGNFPSARP